MTRPTIDGPADVGYASCSNGEQTVAGYFKAGGLRLWPDIDGYGGGEVHVWRDQGDGGTKWVELDQATARHGQPVLFWWQICVHTAYAGTAIDDTLVVAPRLLARFGCPVLVSAINGYDPAELSPSVAWQAARDAVAAVLDAFPLLTAGPVMPILGTGGLKADKIHLSPLGARQCGMALKAAVG